MVSPSARVKMMHTFVISEDFRKADKKRLEYAPPPDPDH